MARRPRGLLVHTFLHVAAKGNRGLPIYLRDSDYQFFLGCLQHYAAQHSVRVHAYCLMTNHFHLLLEVGSVPVSRLMHILLLRQAQYINRVYSYSGHLFKDRYWSRPCSRDEYLLAVLRYIHLNPVRAGLVSHPDQYRWSSHRVYLGVTNVPWVATTILEFFNANREMAAREYVRFLRHAATDHTK